MDQGDEELLRRCQQGDETALDALVRSYQQRIFLLACQVLGDRVSAEEATAQTLVKIWSRCGQWRGQSVAGTWIYRITVRSILDVQRSQTRWWRRWSRPVSAEMHDDRPRPDEEASRHEESRRCEQRVQAAFRQLPETDCVLVHLYSYRGGLYVSAEDGHCYVYAGERQWKVCGKFPNYAHPLGIHDGKLYAGVLNPAGVWAFDGQEWSLLGNPQGQEERCNQIHALDVYRGQLHATTWPEGHVCRLEANGSWTDVGQLGDAMEINALSVYNGQLYGGTIPRAEVFRYNPTMEPGKPVQAAVPEPKPQRRARRPAPPPEPGSAAWTSVRRFLGPAGYEFKDSNEWARVTSLTTFQGKQFASPGSCTSSRLDAPCDFRGTVWSMEAGRNVSYDRDLGPG